MLSLSPEKAAVAAFSVNELLRVLLFSALTAQ